jgi:preprotein translocase subunit SecF
MRPLVFLRKTPNIDFMRRHIAGFAFSIVLTLVSIGGFLTLGLNFGIDFVGGVLIEARSTSGPANIADMRQKIDALHLGENSLQGFGSPIDFRRVEVVGPKVGEELIRSGVLATVLALLAIAAYVWFRFEWQFGVGAIISTAHDVITTVGLFAIFQLEFNLTTLAAILTVAGYSINDTVVIYDRVRETMRKYRTMDFKQLINLSLNETLSRTILTVMTVALAVLSLLLFGGEVLRGFSIAMLWGIVIGTYSSLFIAAPVLYYVRPKRGTEVKKAADAETAAGRAT